MEMTDLDVLTPEEYDQKRIKERRKAKAKILSYSEEDMLAFGEYCSILRPEISMREKLENYLTEFEHKK